MEHSVNEVKNLKNFSDFFKLLINLFDKKYEKKI